MQLSKAPALAILACVLVISEVMGCVGAANRPAPQIFSANTLLQLEPAPNFGSLISPISVSGSRVAIARPRPLAQWSDDPQLLAARRDGTDIWVTDTNGTPAINLTQGQRDGSAWWMGRWSPSAERLAMLSNRGGHVRLWVWHAGRDDLSQKGEMDIAHVLDNYFTDAFEWIDETHIVVPVTWNSPGCGQNRDGGSRFPPTVVDSERHTGSNVNEYCLALLDAETGATRVISSPAVAQWKLSPSKSKIALFFRRTPVRFQRSGPAGDEALGVEVFDRRGDKILSTVSEPWPQLMSLTWSPREDALAYISGRNADTAKTRIVLTELKGGRVTSAYDPTDSLPQVDADSPLTWTSEGLIFRSPRSMVSSENKTGAQWWLADARQRPRRVAENVSEQIARIVLLQNGGLAAFTGSATYRIGPPFRRATKITTSSGLGVILDFELSHHVFWNSRPLTSAFVRTMGEPSASSGFFNFINGDFSAIAAPPGAASLKFADPDTRSAFYLAHDVTGTEMWMGGFDGSRRHRIYRANDILKETSLGEVRAMNYTDSRGRSLWARLTLPVNYDPARKYPVVVWNYPGEMFDNKPVTYNAVVFLQPQVLAGSGYLVVEPSMPLGPAGQARESLAEMGVGVVGAIEQLERQGMIDPHRLFLIGYSYGGYGAMGLITQFKYFAAAVAVSGFCDIASGYGVHAPNFFRGMVSSPQMAGLAEAGQASMGSPPWENPGIYVRNSPLFYAGNVTTPLMLVHGELDWLPKSQSEEFFTALYRQGKRTRLVVYPGEEHAYRGPAHIEDFWRRVIEWFGEFGANAVKPQ